MRGTISARLALGLAVVAACLGFGIGFGAHSLAGRSGSSSVPGASPAAPTPSPATDSGLLGKANVVTAADLGAALPESVKLASLSQSEGQEALLCQRRALASVATLDSLVKAVYTSSGGTVLAEEIVVTVGVPPQTATLERTVMRWNDTCTSPSPTRSRRVRLGVTGAEGWRFSDIGQVPWYAVVVRRGTRLAWLLVSPSEQPANAAGLVSVAQRMIDRLA